MLVPKVKSALAAVAKSEKLSIEDVLGAEEYARQQEEEAEEALLRSKMSELELQEKQVAHPRFLSACGDAYSLVACSS